MSTKETFIINNIKLNVLPTDITLFEDNAVYATSFLRTTAMFSYRSKYATEKVVLTLPISISVNDSTNDEKAIYSREDGLRLLSQLNNYPYCFIQSSRIKSYVAPMGGLSSTDFMMFAVERLAVSQDMGAPDLLMVECHLVFSNISPILSDFKFKDYSNIVSYPIESSLFNDSFKELETNRDKVEELLDELKQLLRASEKSGSYVDGSLPYGTTVLLAPMIIDKDQNNELDNPTDFSPFEKEVKTIEVSAADGSTEFNGNYLDKAESGYIDKSIKKKKLEIAWLAPSDLSFGGVAALQTVRVVRHNNLARQFITSQKHPIVQYMGRNPARVELNYKLNNNSIYSDNQTSLTAAYTHLSNILDYNNHNFPEASAYNNLKIKSIATQALGVSGLIPNQKSISATAEEQNIDNLTLTFVENNLEEFLKISKPILGRGQNSENVQIKEKVVTSYLKNLILRPNDLSSNQQLLRLEMDNYKNLFKFIRGYYNATLSEFAGGVSGVTQLIGTEVTDDYLSSERDNWLLLRNNPKELLPILNIVVDTMELRQSLATKNKEQLQKIKTDTIKIHIVGIGDKLIKPSTNYKRSGLPDIQLGNLLTTIQRLAKAGDVLAINALNSNAASVSDYREANTTNYSGYNFKEFNLSALQVEGGATDPMYFIQPYNHLTDSGMLEVYNEINSSFNDKVDDALSMKQTIDTNSLKENSNLSVPFLNKMDIKEQGYVRESNKKFSIVNNSQIKQEDYLGSSGGNYGLASGGSTAKATVDWNAKENLNVIQLKAKTAIINAVKNSNLIPVESKKDWTVFLIQLAGRESQLGVGKVSSTGARGLFQIVPSTAKSLGYTVDEVTHDFDKSANAAIYYLNIIKNKAISNGYTNWIDFYLLYNFGESGGLSFLNAHSGKIALNNAGIKRIDQQGVQNINSNYFRNTSELVKAYYDLVADHFAPMNKHMQSKNIVISSGKAVKENYSVKVGSKVSDEEISSKFVKVNYYPAQNVNIYGHMFYVTYKGQLYQVALKGIVCPYTPMVNCKLNYKPKSNREITYTKKGQPFSVQALDRLIQLTSGGFYVEKEALVSRKLGTTIAYSLQKIDIAETLTSEGLAFAKPESKYSSIVAKTNLGVFDNPKLPSVRDSEYYSKAMKFANGDKSVSFTDFAVTGYFTDTKEEVLKGISSTTVTKINSMPSVTTNSYLPFKSGTGRVTSVFGKWRPESNRYHFGIDGVPSSDSEIVSIHAAADGEVVQAGWGTGGSGNRIRIYHDKIGFSSQYFHLDQIFVHETQNVRAGQVIGTMGNTGASHGAHIHYQVGIGNSAMGNLVNPFKTTKLSEIPPYAGTDPLGLLEHSKKFLNFDYYMSGEGRNLIDTGKMFTGDSLGAKAQRQGKGDFSPAKLVSDGTDNSDLKVKQDTSESKDRGVPNQFSVYNEDEIVKRQLANMMYPYNQGANTLFPVIKAYITVGTDMEDTILKDLITLAYYFEIDGVSDAKVVCNNDDNPVDMLRLTIANPSFTATDNYAVSGKYLTNNLQSILGPDDIEWVADRIKIKAGTKIHVRAGYGNNPNDLTTIFNGVVTQTSGEKGATLDLLCEGFGRELLQTQIGADKPFTAGGEFHNSSTPLIFSRSLLQSSINHFGTRSNFTNTILALLTPFSNIHEDDRADPEAKRLVTRFNLNPFTSTSGMGIFFTEGNIKQRLFTNIYSAEIEQLQPQFSSRIGTYLSNLTSLTEKSGYFYIFEGQTPWESMKEMEYRSPGTLVKPLMYEDRMTLFFGLKEQMYIANELDNSFMSSVVSDDADSSQSESITTQYLEQRTKRMDLVSRFHIATSNSNILSNGIGLNSNFATEVDVLYFEDDDERLELKKEDGLSSKKMSLDDNLNYWEYRNKTISMPGTHGEYSSFVYGTTALRREAETMYGGKITLIGNPKIKAGDYIFIDDDVKKISGIIKVRECIHSFGLDGFITEITPGLYIEASNFYYTSLFLKLGLTAQTAIAFANYSNTLTAHNNSDYNILYDAFAKSTNNSLLTNFTETSRLALYNTGGMPLITSAFIALTAYNSFNNLQKIGLKSSTVLRGISFVDSSLIRASAFIERGAGAIYKGYDAMKSGRAFQKLRSASNLVRFASYAADSGIASTVGLFSVLSKVRKGSTAVLTVLAANPFTTIVALVGTFVLSYLEAKIQEGMLTRQPLMLYPLNYMGRPFVAGISGFSVNSWLDSKLTNLSTNSGYISKDAQSMILLRPTETAIFIKRMLAASYNKQVASNLITEKDDKEFKK